MSKKAAKTMAGSLLLSVLLHALLFSSFLLIKLYPVVPHEKTPALYVPSYVYQNTPSSTVNETKSMPQQQREKEKVPTDKQGIEKPAKSSSPQTQAVSPHQRDLSAVRFAKNAPVVDIGKPTDEAPIHMVGESKIVKPLAKLLGQALTAHLSYPKIAVDFALRGVALVGFTLHPDGTVTDAQLMRSSGAGVLDQAALAAVNAISPVEHVSLYLKQPDFLVVALIFG